MIPYIIVFILTISFTFFAEICFRFNRSYIGYILFLVAILFPSLLAGFRDSGIGTDTKLYVDEVFYKIKYIHSLPQFWNSYTRGEFKDIELVYLIINLIANILGTKVQYIYFLANFTTLFFVYASIYKNRKLGSMWLAVLIYMLLYYNMSLNIVRQNLAMAIALYSFKFLEEKRWLAFIFWLFITIKAHNTGIFMLLFVACYILIFIKKKLKRNIFYILSLIFLSVFFILFDRLVILSVALHLLPQKFLLYINNAKQVVLLTLTLGYIFLFILMFLIYIIISKNKNSNKSILFHFLYLRFVGMLIILTSALSKWAFRLSFYVNYIVDMILMPRFFYFLKKKNKLLYSLLLLSLIFFLLIYWYRTIVINNDNDTYPYKSQILGI